MRKALAVIQPVRERPVLAERHSTVSICGTSVVQVLCDADLENSVRDLDDLGVEHRNWLLVDLASVRSATPFMCRALVTAMDHVSPKRFCVVVPPCAHSLRAMLPSRVRPVTFRSIGDALQMLVFAGEGLDAGWMVLAGAVGPFVQNLSHVSPARRTSTRPSLVDMVAG